MIKKLIKMFLTMIELQLFLNIISLLIIAHWGLPLSFLAPVSNIVFSPFLTGFLFLSSLIFFFELLYIPNEWLIYLLECLTKIWSSSMSLANRSCIISVSKPSLFFIVCCTITTFAVLQCNYLKSSLYRSASFIFLLITILLYLGYIQIPDCDVAVIPLGKKSLKIMYTQGTIAIIDQGGLSQHTCTRSWIELTLLPFLRKNYAHDIISHLIVLQPTVKTFRILQELCITTTVKNAYIPYWQGTTQRNLAQAYSLARNNLEKHGKLHRIGKKNIVIALNTANTLELIPQKEQKKYHTINYSDIQIRYLLENKNFLE